MEYLIHIAILASIYGILGLSLNLIVGETGLLSVAHAAFFGIGAYAAALLMTVVGLNFFLAAILGIVFTGLIAAAIGIVFSQLSGVYYAFASLGFNVIAYNVFLNWQSVTRGPIGIPGIPRPSIFGVHLIENAAYLILVVIALVFTYWVCSFITRSSLGRVLRAIREDEELVSVFGYQVSAHKLTVFIISGMLAGIAGALFASYISFISPSSFTLAESILVLSIIIFGGLSSHKGAVLGAIALVALPELLRFVGFPVEVAAQMRQGVYGLVLILLMLYRPRGIWGTFRL